MDAKAEKLGALEIGVTKVKSKRFYVVYNSKRINFGSKTGLTFIDHHDIDVRKAWRQRFSKIKIKKVNTCTNLQLVQHFGHGIYYGKF